MNFLYKRGAYILLTAVAVLLVLGIIVLFSTSAFAKESHGDMYYFVKRQLLWLVIGIVLCVIASLIDYHWWEKTWWIWLVGGTLLLVLCFVPPVGIKINGSWRWVSLRIVTFQPSEIGKLAVAIFLAWWFSKFRCRSDDLLVGFLFPVVIAGIPTALIANEVDLGTTVLILGTAFLIMFAAGISLYRLVPLTIIGLGVVLYVAVHIHERAGRLTAFLHPEQYRLEEGLQQWQALIAFGSGGITGLGLGEGRQKYSYLPYAHTDFIFAMIGEEIGLIATLTIVLCYLLIFLCGALISFNARDYFGILLGFGLTVLITLQAMINIGVSISLLPNKGMPLPFISYGGSNMAICLSMVGILLNIYRMGYPLSSMSPCLLVTSHACKN
ncbi:Lipid II flippase FtsW [Candidatus Xiphinematobacter sp. Idaho Grape]|uniref:putative lipid II flippase FtsW n=1 Tax=Candidatus Xiphinematobacter sp. Idaho Grape TaxID=1704307 RepID=UPI0007063647|nr:putative lipid II flippase FtsW [Candidatus Xiphinematobacter sp. Idaho Grape]ALJ56534.1 Lipid II flippase FtsW [Candidatus Xiphinematobacter sp. Idaho Grape]